MNGLHLDDDPSALFDSIAADSIAAAAATDIPPETTDNSKPLHIPTDKADPEGSITSCLLRGELEAAVDLCLKDSLADAIMLSIAGGPQLLATTQDKYFKQVSGAVSKLVCSVVSGDWSSVVQTCDISCWKEALAAVFTYAKDEQLSTLCGKLITTKNIISVVIGTYLSANGT